MFRSCHIPYGCDRSKNQQDRQQDGNAGKHQISQQKQHKSQHNCSGGIPGHLQYSVVPGKQRPGDAPFIICIEQVPAIRHIYHVEHDIENDKKRNRQPYGSGKHRRDRCNQGAVNGCPALLIQCNGPVFFPLRSSRSFSGFSNSRNPSNRALVRMLSPEISFSGCTRNISTICSLPLYLSVGNFPQ